MAKTREDPLDKITKLIEDKISEAFESRDRKETESKDPWARLEGVVDRAVTRHFEALNKGLEEGKSREHGRNGGDEKDGGGDEGDEGGVLGLFGMGGKR
jgi:hypothetical protein